jgi:hypothetical protein
LRIATHAALPASRNASIFGVSLARLRDPFRLGMHGAMLHARCAVAYGGPPGPSAHEFYRTKVEHTAGPVPDAVLWTARGGPYCNLPSYGGPSHGIVDWLGKSQRYPSRFGRRPQGMCGRHLRPPGWSASLHGAVWRVLPLGGLASSSSGSVLR